MTLNRSITTFGLIFVLIISTSAQSAPSVSGTAQLNDEQIIMLDSLAADSTSADLLVPNVFSPNGDGTNDFIEVNTDGTTVYEFIIFSRTGTRVYHSKSPRIFWDGRTDGGQQVNTGVYYFVLEEQDNPDPLKKAGFIYLYR